MIAKAAPFNGVVNGLARITGPPVWQQDAPAPARTAWQVLSSTTHKVE